MNIDRSLIYVTKRKDWKKEESVLKLKS